jgi:hypothetical protein
VFDEAAFWREETSSSRDVETYRAVLPALASTGGMVIGISSPYAERGIVLWKIQSGLWQRQSGLFCFGVRIFNSRIAQSPCSGMRNRKRMERAWHRYASQRR